MPIYEYQCSDCLKSFSVHVSMDEYEKKPLPTCQHCGSTNIKRIFSGVTVITSKKS